MGKIRLVKSKVKEMSGTGGSATATPGTGAQYAAPKAFPKVAADYNKTFGTHFAPSIPNRPSKAIIYKELWEDFKVGDKVTYLGHPGKITSVNKEMTGAITYNVEYDKGNGKTKASNIYNKDGEIKLLGEEYGEFDMEDAGPDYNSISDLGDELRRLVRWSNQYGKGADDKIEQLRKRIEYLKTQSTSVNENTDMVVATLNNPNLDPDVKKLLFKGYRDGHLTADKIVSMVKNLLMTRESTDDANFDSGTEGGEGLQSTNPLPPSLNEGRYNEFKKSTRVRTPAEQLHRAVREIRRKIDEINRLVEYTERMKNEMQSDVSEVNYLKRTKEALSKISARIQETNNKIKRLVQ